MSEARYEWARSKEFDAAITWVIAAAKGQKKKPLIHNGRKPT